MFPKAELKLFLCLVSLAMLLSVASIAQDTVTQETVQLQVIGTGSPDQGSTGELPATDRSLEFRRQDLENLVAEGTDVVATMNALATAPLTFPTVQNNGISNRNRGFFGFDALDHADQRLAGTGIYKNSQFSIEPPDQGLCVGNGFVVEQVNLAFAVYKADGTTLAGPTPLNQFFKLAPAVIRSNPPVFGDFTSDPRCVYDPQTRRFFVLLLQLDVDPSSGDFTGPTSLLLAVSKTSDPTKDWNLFKLPTTFDGQNCPCFGDQPLMGFDKNGLYLSTNAFSLVTGRFVGVQIYAMSKGALAKGALPPFVLHLGLPSATQPDGRRDFSVQPAVSRKDDNWDSDGTEYFLGSFNTRLLVENNVVAYALSDTNKLKFRPTPNLKFTFTSKVVSSEVYGVPPDANQKRGTLPLGSVVDPNVFELLSTNEHRMQQVTFADGELWSSVTTGLQSLGETDLKAGVAWFNVRVSGDANQFQAKMKRQGYVAIANANAFFPAVGIGDGTAAIGFTISGADFFPSTGYVQLRDGKAGSIHFAGLGVNSEDGFTGYPHATSSPPPCTDPDPNGNILCSARWGDYGAAATDEEGSVWLANEYIGPRPRTVNANWGTFITRLKGEADD